MSTPSNLTAGTTTVVQVLLDAEKDANRIVQLSRQHRVQRLKEAQIEAKKEIEELRRREQEKYTNYEKSVLGSLDATVQEYARDTAISLEEIRQIAQERRAEVVKLLLETVVKVEPQMHQNTVLRIREGN